MATANELKPATPNAAPNDGNIPDVEKVKIDVQKEILKLAQRDGIREIKMLDMDVIMKRRQYYASTVKAYYEGYDIGYVDAAAAAATALDNMQKAIEEEQAKTGSVTAALDKGRRAVKLAMPAGFIAGGFVVGTVWALIEILRHAH